MGELWPPSGECARSGLDLKQGLLLRRRQQQHLSIVNERLLLASVFHIHTKRERWVTLTCMNELCSRAHGQDFDGRRRQLPRFRVSKSGKGGVGGHHLSLSLLDVETERGGIDGRGLDSGQHYVVVLVQLSIEVSRTADEPTDGGS